MFLAMHTLTLTQGEAAVDVSNDSEIPRFQGLELSSALLFFVSQLYLFSPPLPIFVLNIKPEIHRNMLSRFSRAFLMIIFSLVSSVFPPFPFCKTN